MCVTGLDQHDRETWKRASNRSIILSAREKERREDEHPSHYTKHSSWTGARRKRRRDKRRKQAVESLLEDLRRIAFNLLTPTRRWCLGKHAASETGWNSIPFVDDWCRDAGLEEKMLVRKGVERGLAKQTMQIGQVRVQAAKERDHQGLLLRTAAVDISTPVTAIGWREFCRGGDCRVAILTGYTYKVRCRRDE